MAMNAEWHRSHPMPASPTLDQRVAWHREHMKACGCRKPPAAIAAVLATEADDPGDAGHEA